MRLTNLDMDALRSFVAGIDARSFAQAADRLGRSTSAVSAQLKKLEDQAGTALVRKSGRGLTLTDAGEVLEAKPQQRLVLKWRNEFPELKPEGYTRCTFELTPQGDLTRLEVIHEAEMDNSKTIAAISGGWPRILSNLKTFLETGEVLTFPGK